MSAVILQISDGVVDALNAASLSQSFTAVRAYVPAYELTDLTDLRVTVVPRSLSATPLSRKSDEFEYQVDVAIHRRVPADVSGSDPYLDLAEEVVDLFRGGSVAGYPCTGIANEPIYDPAFLDQKGVLITVVTLTFRAVRDRA